EPVPAAGPLFCLVRGVSGCAWSVHAQVPDEIAFAIDQLALAEPGTVDFSQPPVHSDEYRKLLGGSLSPRCGRKGDPFEQSGPAMTFPDALPAVSDVAHVEDERRLSIEFRGWVIGEIAGGRAPVLAVFEHGRPVSVCFCARSSPAAAEAGVETARPYPSPGPALRRPTAWALALQSEGRMPLYSTQWTNHASLALARKLGLKTYAGTWCLIEPEHETT